MELRLHRHHGVRGLPAGIAALVAGFANGTIARILELLWAAMQYWQWARLQGDFQHRR